MRNLEQRIEGLVSGVFGRAFAAELQPVEIARKLAKEMDSHRTASVSRVYVPNSYTVWVSPDDHERLEGYERSLAGELAAYLLEHARERGYNLLSRPEVTIREDDRLRLGEFGIQARLVKHQAGADPEKEPVPAEHGQTMVYMPPVPAEAAVPDAAPAGTRAIVTLGQRRHVYEGPVVVIGRSKQADCVINDENVSRRHAELRRGPDGTWLVSDLGSTNGTKVNGRPVQRARLNPGDYVELGTSGFTFDIDPGR